MTEVIPEDAPTLEEVLEEYRGRLDYASQLLSLVVAKFGGKVELTLADLDVDVNGVQIENLADAGFVISTFVDDVVAEPSE